MDESVQTTFEEAKRCPKCGKPGEDRRTIAAPPTMKRGTTIHMIYCVTELCPWFNTPWNVQVNPDGSIPPPTNHTGQKKLYQGFEGHDEQAKAIIDNLKAQTAAQTQQHTEIRNPNA